MWIASPLGLYLICNIDLVLKQSFASSYEASSLNLDPELIINHEHFR